MAQAMSTICREKKIPRTLFSLVPNKEIIAMKK